MATQRKKFSPPPIEHLVQLIVPADPDTRPYAPTDHLGIQKALVKANPKWNFPPELIQAKIQSLTAEGILPRSLGPRIDLQTDSFMDLSMSVAVPKHIAPTGRLAKSQRKALLHQWANPGAPASSNPGESTPAKPAGEALDPQDFEHFPPDGASDDTHLDVDPPFVPLSVPANPKKRQREEPEEEDSESDDDDDDRHLQAAINQSLAPRLLLGPDTTIELDLSFPRRPVGIHRHIFWMIPNRTVNGELTGFVYIRVNLLGSNITTIQLDVEDEVIVLSTHWTAQVTKRNEEGLDGDVWKTCNTGVLRARRALHLDDVRIRLPHKPHPELRPKRYDDPTQKYALFVIPLAEPIDDSAWTLAGHVKVLEPHTKTIL